MQVGPFLNAGRYTYWLFAVREDNAKGGVARTIPFTKTAMVAFMAYRTAFGLPAVPAEGDQTPLLLSPRTRPMMIGDKPVKELQSRQFFGDWGSLSSRKSLYFVVKSRLAVTALWLRSQHRDNEADALARASPHWLRHTFAKASLLKGHDVRIVSALLGHASVTTTMIYTDQDALDLIRAYEQEEGVGKVAQG